MGIGGAKASLALTTSCKKEKRVCTRGTEVFCDGACQNVKSGIIKIVFVKCKC